MKKSMKKIIKEKSQYQDKKNKIKKWRDVTN